MRPYKGQKPSEIAYATPRRMEVHVFFNPSFLEPQTQALANLAICSRPLGWLTPSKHFLISEQNEVQVQQATQLAPEALQR